MSFFKHMLHDVKVLLLAYVYTHTGKKKTCTRGFRFQQIFLLHNIQIKEFKDVNKLHAHKLEQNL